MTRYDSIIIGAGHNGLVCGAALAKAGQRVLILEAAPAAGGLARSREFHPGFHAPPAHTLSYFPEQVSTDLQLKEHGLDMSAAALPTVGLAADGAHVAIDGKALSGCSDADQAAFGTWSATMQRFAATLAPFWFETMPRIANSGAGSLLTFARLGWNIRKLGRHDMQELLRIATLPVRDLMDETFDSELLKATLCWDGLIGSRFAPRSPNGAVLAMLYRRAGGAGAQHCLPAGGIKSLVEALLAAASAGGAEIRTEAPVERILVKEDKSGVTATGVRLQDGEEIAAGRIISASDPQRTFLELLGVEKLDIGFTNRIRRLRCDGLVAKLHLALDSTPDFRGLDKRGARMLLAPDMDTIEFAFDNAKYGELPDTPVMEVVLPGIHDESLAPAGKQVLSAHVMYVPRRLKGGWDAASRERMAERAIDTLARYAPGIREQIIHHELLTPADLEDEYRVTGGHWHHTEFALDQLLMMRPTYGAAQYATPLPGLFLCGAGSHPGGDLTGAAGWNAAREILR